MSQWGGFRSSTLALCYVATAFLIAGGGRAVAATASQPTTVTLFSDAGSNSELVLDITNIQGSCVGAGQSGNGKISSLVLFGHDLTSLTGSAPAVPFEHLCIDAAGNIVGGSVKLTSDFSTPLESLDGMVERTLARALEAVGLRMGEG